MSKPPSPELFREVFGRFATGVAVITGAGAGGTGGMTANALCSLSLDPLLALVCFENRARTLPIVRDAGRFGVNLLAVGPEDLAGGVAGVGVVGPAGVNSGCRPHDRNRRGDQPRPWRRRAAALVQRPLPRAAS